MSKVVTIVQWMIAALVVLSVSASSQPWTSLNGPLVTKNVKDITINNAGSHLYSADNVRLLKSTNSGATWRGVASDILSPLVVVAKPDVADGSNITVSGIDFFKHSNDGGANWTDGPLLLTTNLTPLRNCPKSLFEICQWGFLLHDGTNRIQSWVKTQWFSLIGPHE